MTATTPIYLIAKNLGINSNRVILACNTLGIDAKASSKRLNKVEVEKITNYFETGRNAAQETIEIKNPPRISKETVIKPKNEGDSYTNYFPNRLIG